MLPYKPKSDFKYRELEGVKLAAVSLGCSKNRIDTEEILGLLSGWGVVLTDDYSAADIIIVNTCSFIEQAQQESVNKLLEISRSTNRQPKIVAAGCLVELFGSNITKTIPEIDGAIGAHSYGLLEKFIKLLLSGRRPVFKKKPSELFGSLAPRILTGPVHSANVKIAEGCSNRCHYCLIPSIRGSYRSRRPDEIVSEIKGLLEKGAREINLIAQDTTAYGTENDNFPDFTGLIRQILEIKAQFWLRIMYAYPSRIDDQLIDLIASESRICKYLDIPIQHVSDRVLGMMNRSYDQSQLIKLLQKLRQRIPGLVLRTTCMVGYPGEGVRQFKELINFIREHPFERLGAFTYSSQEGTTAASLPGALPFRVAKRRHRALMQTQQQISEQLNRKLIGKEMMVLVEKAVEANQGGYYGRTEYQAPEVDGGVYFCSPRPLSPGDLVRVRVLAASPYNLLAKAI